MVYSLKIELMNELNMLKDFLKDAEKNGEINHSEREKIMGYVGSIKRVLYDDLMFKKVYINTEHSLRVGAVAKGRV